MNKILPPNVKLSTLYEGISDESRNLLRTELQTYEYSTLDKDRGEYTSLLCCCSNNNSSGVV